MNEDEQRRKNRAVAAISHALLREQLDMSASHVAMIDLIVRSAVQCAQADYRHLIAEALIAAAAVVDTAQAQPHGRLQ